MGRRTKAELQQANYYEWLEDCNKLREKKKNGDKLEKPEKMLLRTIPTPEAPYRRVSDVLQGGTPVRKKKIKKASIDFDKSVVWPTRARYFLCAVYNVPYGDEQCLLFCTREDCPFYQVGYFRAHGVKF